MAEIKKTPKFTPVENSKRLEADLKPVLTDVDPSADFKQIEKNEKSSDEFNDNTSSRDGTSQRKDECRFEASKVEETNTEIPVLTKGNFFLIYISV